MRPCVCSSTHAAPASYVVKYGFNRAGCVLNNGYLPEIGDSIPILAAASLTGEFSNVLWPVIIGDRGFTVSYPDGQTAVLEVVAMSPIAGDLNGDGFVGLDDLDTVLGNWNAGTPPDTDAAIPEPGVMVLLVVSACCVVMRRD